MSVLAIAVVADIGIAIALVVPNPDEEAPADWNASKTADESKDEEDPPAVDPAWWDAYDATEDVPTYADSCPELPDPADIGHGLGRLFEEAGEPKAGCGQSAAPVLETGAWVAAGICEGTMRSTAVAGAAGTVALLYGEAAEFAWDRAQDGTLIAAEAAEPGAGDVYLIKTLSGTFGFVRSTRSAVAGREYLRTCGEATGRARPFVRMPPLLLLLWLELTKQQASWSWPELNSTSAEETVAFVTVERGEYTATGGCANDFECHVTVDDDRWQLDEGTGYVRLADLAPYMPRHEV
jgi:hypothetical protein